MRRFVDREAGCGWNFRFPDRLLDSSLDEDPVPVWPMLKTRYLPARSLNSNHFGTEFRLAEGMLLGMLTKISTVETIDGFDFTAEFEHAEAPITDSDTELMYWTGTKVVSGQ
ncbi:hypothetical protein [Arthrobacter sp. W4I7]|uniref:hypothetical protein n=1 Tax=Arthrobacter sp. W4I7 TaxID=3042296 RepID=UPI00278230C8|nr:hypothetical protein [Arthrobacter sp. W4I7]MDQ0690957.1 hypothetical protein [Arthrobacter sp. W4I7]